MALSIPCRHCGPRPVEEFMYGEVLTVPDSIGDPDARDVDRVFMRANPNGPAPEAWFHTFGCRRWSYLTRDRSTDDWV
ncbi:MAG TPA: sarcosine oxidase subunit delta [Acidimicrobiia bacterium]|nr:sarcosine oxidase subunit delta [Acidimicrobiia bacterium]